MHIVKDCAKIWCMGVFLQLKCTFRLAPAACGIVVDLVV